MAQPIPNVPVPELIEFFEDIAETSALATQVSGFFSSSVPEPVVQPRRTKPKKRTRPPLPSAPLSDYIRHYNRHYCSYDADSGILSFCAGPFNPFPEGYCYLAAFEPERRTEAAAVLGPNPRVASFSTFFLLQQHPSGSGLLFLPLLFSVDSDVVHLDGSIPSCEDATDSAIAIRRIGGRNGAGTRVRFSYSDSLRSILSSLPDSCPTPLHLDSVPFGFSNISFHSLQGAGLSTLDAKLVSFKLSHSYRAERARVKYAPRASTRFVPRVERDGYCWARALPRSLPVYERLRLLVETGPNPPCSYLHLLFKSLGCTPRGVLTFDPHSQLYHVERGSSPFSFADVAQPDLGCGSIASKSSWDSISSSSYKDAYHGRVAARLLKSNDLAEKICPYLLKPHQADYLQKFGIPHVADASDVHPHAEFKAVENYLLYADLPPRLAGDVMFCSIKEFKALNVLREARVSGPALHQLDFSQSTVNSFFCANPVLTSADASRYKRSIAFPDATTFSPTQIVLFDSAHYMEFSHISYLFSRYPRLEQVFCIMNIPPEVQYRADSLYPQNYTLSYVGERVNVLDPSIPSFDRSGSTRFTFHFSQNRGTTYEQPISCLDWLSCREIRTSTFQLGVERLLSIGPQHLFSVTRDQRNFDTERSFCCPDVARLPVLHPSSAPLNQPFIPLKIFRQVLLHAKSLNNYQPIDTYAKARSYAAQDSNIPLQTLETFCQLVQFYKTHYHPNKPDANPSVLDTFFEWVHSLTSWLLSHFGSVGRRIYSWLYSNRLILQKLLLWNHQDKWLIRFQLRSFLTTPSASSYLTFSPPHFQSPFVPFSPPSASSSSIDLPVLHQPPVDPRAITRPSDGAPIDFAEASVLLGHDVGPLKGKAKEMLISAQPPPSLPPIPAALSSSLSASSSSSSSDPSRVPSESGFYRRHLKTSRSLAEYSPPPSELRADPSRQGFSPHDPCSVPGCSQHTYDAEFHKTRPWHSCQGGHGFHGSAKRPNQRSCHLCPRAPRAPRSLPSVPHILPAQVNLPSSPGFEDPRAKPSSFPKPLAVSRPRSIPLTFMKPTKLPPPSHPQPAVDFLPSVILQAIPSDSNGLVSDFSLCGIVDSNTSALVEHRLSNRRAVNAPYPKYDCLLRAFSQGSGVSVEELWRILTNLAPFDSLHQSYLGSGLSSYHAHLLGLYLKVKIFMRYPLGSSNCYPVLGYTGSDCQPIGLTWTPTTTGGHFEPCEPTDSPFTPFTFVSSKIDNYDPARFVSGSGLTPTTSASLHHNLVSSLKALPHVTFHSFTPSLARAKAFWNAFRNREVGVCFDSGFLKLDASDEEKITAKLEFACPKAVQLAVLEGLPGSGKSRPVLEALARNHASIRPGVFAMGFPRVFLRTDVCDKMPKLIRNLYSSSLSGSELDNKVKRSFLKSQKNCFRTFEHVLANASSFAIFDEFTLFPPGYFDFYLIHQQSCTHLLLLGDRLQGGWAPDPKQARVLQTLLSLPTNKDVFCSFSSAYRFYSYRIPQRIAVPLGIHSLSPVDGFVDFQWHLPSSRSGYPLLIPQNAPIQTHESNHFKTYTYTSIQGAEFEVVVMKVNQATLDGCELEAVFTALTRCTHGLIIQCDLNPTQALRLAQHPIFGPLLDHQLPTTPCSFFRNSLRSVDLLLPPSIQHITGAGFDVTRPSEVLSRWSNERLDNLPASFRANAPLYVEYFTASPNAPEPSLNDPSIHTHLASSCNPNCWPELEPVLPREDRELVHRGEMSSQFLESSKKGAFDYAANLFPKQSAKQDPTLFASAIKTRFDYSTPAENEFSFEQKKWLGPILFDRFREFLRLPLDDIPFEPETFVLSVIQTVAVKLNKPIATIWNNVDRSEPEWLPNFMHAFVKSQSKAKAETSARSFRLTEDCSSDLLAPFAKPGQPLVTSADFNVFNFGPWTRYMRSILYRLMPSHIYIHGGKTLSQLDAFSREYSTVGIASTCDFTKYDMSCKAETLSFELCLFSYFGLDLQFPDLVSLYYFIKTHMFTQLGTSGIMRFTGEFGTYDFNTWYNIAYMAFRFQLDRDSPPLGCCFSGDDSLFFFLLSERPDWPLYSRSFSLVGKFFFSESKDFCGWWLLPCGAVRNPILLALKILYKQARNDLVDSLDSYFLEAYYAYSHGDALHDFLPPLALEAQSWVINFCFQNSSIVPHLSILSTRSIETFYSSQSTPVRLLKRILQRTGLNVLPFFSYLPLFPSGASPYNL